MSALMITYDLKKPGQDYKSLHAAIKGLGSTWWHYLESTWIVVTPKTPSLTWDALAPHVDKNDNLLIVNVTSDSTAGWLPPDAWSWIQANV